MIKSLLKAVPVKGHIVTIDAIGTQKEIVKKIQEGKGGYALAVILLRECEKEGRELLEGRRKSAGQIEQREYWQTEDVNWFVDKAKWAVLMSFGVNKTMITKSV